MCLLPCFGLPQFGGEQATGKPCGLLPAEASALQGGRVVRQTRGPEPGKQAEGEVESADQQGSREAERPARGHAKVRQEPKRPRCEMGAKLVEQGVHLRGGQAVQKEVSHDKVEEGLPFKRDGPAEIGLQDSEAGLVLAGAEREALEHATTTVDCQGVEAGVGGQKRMEEASVAIAQHQGMPAAVEGGEEVLAGAAQQRATGEQLQEVVGPGQAVERADGRASGHLYLSVAEGRAVAW